MDEQVMDPFISGLRFIEGARRTTNGRFVTTLSRVLALKLGTTVYGAVRIHR